MPLRYGRPCISAMPPGGIMSLRWTIMDVTVGNFRTALAFVRQYLPSASFVSIDLEFTGLGDSRPSQLDTPEARYRNARQDVDEYVPIQFGLAIFRCSDKGWQVLSFNFNLAPGAVYYPQSARYPLIDRKFTLQGSTVTFLARHGFDFDKCLRLGVSWLSKDKESHLRKHVETDIRQRRDESVKEKNLDEEAKKLTADLAESVSKFITEAESNLEDPSKQTTLLPLSPSIAARAITFRFIRRHYPRIVAKSIWTSEGTRLRLRMYKTKEEASARREEDIQTDVDDIVSRAGGFRYVIDAITEARVPLLVHNGLIDITKLYGTFVGTPPETLSEFKRAFRKAFPLIYDTRLIVQQLAARDVAVHEAVIGKRLDLSELVSVVREIAKTRDRVAQFHTFIPTARVSDIGRLAEAHVVSLEGFTVSDPESYDPEQDRYGFGRYLDGHFDHEAGSDAVQTGFLFGLIAVLVEKRREAFKDLENEEGKIPLSSCGGYQWVDFRTEDEDEVNTWFGKDVVVVSRKSPGEGKLEARSTLQRIFAGTTYESVKHEIKFAGPDAFFVILSLEKAELTVETLAKIQTNANEIGVDVRKYSREALSDDNVVFTKNKKRRFSMDQR